MTERSPEFARVPPNGWDEPAEIKRAQDFLKALDNEYSVADADTAISYMQAHGIAPNRAYGLMLARWPVLAGTAAELRADLNRSVQIYYAECLRPPGRDAAGDEFEEDRKPEFRAAGLKVQRASNVHMQPLHWLWPARIPESKLTLFAGYPDQGKSQVAANVTSKITTGGEWPDGEGNAPKGVVIYISSEDDVNDTLKPRLAAAGANMNNILFVSPMVRDVSQGRKVTRVFNLDDDLKRLSHIVEDERGRGNIVRLIVFDPLNAFYGGAKKVDSNNPANMRAMLTPIAEWSSTHKIAVIGIMHFNKGDNAHTLYRVTGSMAVVAAARAVWYFNKDPDSEIKDEKFVMVMGKHNLSRAKQGLSYKIDDREVQKDPLIRAPFVEWLGPTNVTADDAFSLKRREREAEGVNTALKYLKDAFTGQGVVLTAAQMDDCRVDAGVSPMTFTRAKQQLGVVCIRPHHIGERSTYRLRTAADDFADELFDEQNSHEDDFADDEG